MYPRDIITSIKYFGIFPIMQAGLHRFERRIGLAKLGLTSAPWKELKLNSFVEGRLESRNPQRLLQHARFFPVCGVIKQRDILSKIIADADEVVKCAEDAGEGKFTLFSCDALELGRPVKWHQNPFSKYEFPRDKHWCRINYFVKEQGDIKLTWEVSRFSWTFALVRAFVLTGNEKYAQTFWELFEDWLAANQPNHGVNWVSGQECALRVIAWCFGLFAFLDQSPTTQQHVEKLLLAFAVHGERIERFISHAIRQKTNHAITEAAGLYTLGTLFPFLRKARRWKALGEKVLQQQGLRQIYDDGSYVQQSMNYHRLMLHTYLWCFQLAKLNGQKFSRKLTERVFRATEFSYQMQDADSGRVPNYGANDGALILPLNSCNYLDYRPVIQACWYLFKREKLYNAGPWDEDLFWLFGPDALNAPWADRQRVSSQFSKGGYYTLRSKNSWAMIRCHSYCDRVGHVDMLHLDIWANGINLLRDCGTYRYYAPNEPAVEYYFKSIWAHNTVAVDGESPLRPASRFIWLPWPKAKLLRFEVAGEKISWKGTHLAYDRPGWNVGHARQVVVEQDRWEIMDQLTGRGQHKLELRWHLTDEAAIVAQDSKKVRMRLTPDWFLEVSSPEEIKVKLLRARPNGGWESLYYNNKQPICTLSVISECELPLRFKTTICKEAK